MQRRAIVCGGSIAGLFVASFLQRSGWSVDVYERTVVGLAGRGAGIVTHATLIHALKAVDAEVSALGVEVSERVAFDKDGRRVTAMAFPQVVTSWDRVHQILRALISDRSYHLGRQITGYEQGSDSVTAIFSDGSRETADLLVGADGFRSAIRGQMAPEVVPRYSGYVVWRALAQEADLPEPIRREVFPTFGFYAPAGTQIIGYPIAGTGNDLRSGRRRYNFVWYAEVSEAELDDMLTDARGRRHEISIPPPLVREDILARMRKEAEKLLPAPFVEILDRSERPFFTPIYDHHSTVMARGRVALAGDAACVARPHVGMGVTKAALDGQALARHLESLPPDQALAAYSEERVPASHAAHERARKLGRYIFEDRSGANRNGRSNPRLDEIMRTTAVNV